MPPDRDPVDDVSAHTVVDARHALDALPDGVVIADEDGVVRLVNDRAAALLGTTREAAEGGPLTEVVAVTNQEGAGWVACTRPYEGLVTRTGVPEQSWILPSGDEVLVTARIHRAPGHGRVTDVAVSLRSGRARARLDRDRSDLVATVAHELRSPLTGVKGFVQALLNRWDRLNDEQKKLMLTTVHADSDRLSRLITELLDVARLDTGRLAMHQRPCDIRVMTARVIESVRAGAPHRIEFRAPDDLPEVWADPDKFTQVLTNLIENAIRHGSDPVTVTAAKEGEQVSVQVDDSGNGIPREIRQRAFTKFWTTGQRGGSGLGLYLVNGLVKAHGGTTTIDDAPEGGARITTTWPAFVAEP
ncbi:ATP-binding protein [Nocardioides sp.]|uniref:sensor histidine kinase n=1 Tax=Nocardioides sp. TaxID=35761 RepID=UPI002F420850